MSPTSRRARCPVQPVLPQRSDSWPHDPSAAWSPTTRPRDCRRDDSMTTVRDSARARIPDGRSVPHTPEYHPSRELVRSAPSPALQAAGGGSVWSPRQGASSISLPRICAATCTRLYRAAVPHRVQEPCDARQRAPAPAEETEEAKEAEEAEGEWDECGPTSPATRTMSGSEAIAAAKAAALLRYEFQVDRYRRREAFDRVVIAEECARHLDIAPTRAVMDDPDGELGRLRRHFVEDYLRLNDRSVMYTLAGAASLAVLQRRRHHQADLLRPRHPAVHGRGPARGQRGVAGEDHRRPGPARRRAGRGRPRPGRPLHRRAPRLPLHHVRVPLLAARGSGQVRGGLATVRRPVQRMADPKRVTNRAKGPRAAVGLRRVESIEGRPRLVAWGAWATPHATAEPAPRNLHQSS
jgi:hypothetical protein